MYPMHLQIGRVKVTDVTTEKDIDAIYQAKLDGTSDEVIMKQFSVGLKEIERAVVKKTGANLNLFATKPKFSGFGPKDFTPESTTVWSFKNRGKWATHNGNYRGNWSPYIPRNVILRYSQPGDLVLDQFCGGGTTAVEAKLLGRRCIARDISHAAVSLTQRNLDFEFPVQEKLDGSAPTVFYEPSIEAGDARNLSTIKDESIDLICTHPPYANIVQYSDGIEGDISFHDVDDFIDDMKQVAKESYRILKTDGVCAVLIGDMRRKKRVGPLGFRTIEAFLEQGFHLKDLIIKRQHNCRTTGFWYTSSIKYNFLLLAQEYLPIFVKIDSSPVERRAARKQKFALMLEEVKIPSAPTEMQCKTTWVLPSDQAEDSLNANILNRYGGGGQVLRVDIVPSKEESEISGSREFDLLYINAIGINTSLKEKPTSHSRLLEKVISPAAAVVKPGGHLILRVRDINKKGMTSSPALQLWRNPKSPFHIREIIVVTTDNSTQEETRGILSVVHEYLLVYQYLK
ncbi:MAG: TRM11 family SAM-dependent methyltransferase [Candidatus Thorarchaeota archaeon]